MKVLMAPIGTSGDLYPYVALGSELQARGHEVVILSDALKADSVRRAGLGFESVMSGSDWQNWSRRTIELGHAGDSGAAAANSFRHMVVPNILPLYHAAVEQHEHHDVVLVGDVKTIGFRLAHEQHGIPFVHLVLWTGSDAPAPTKIVGAVQHTTLNLIRRAIGLPDLTEPWGRWLGHPDRALAAYPGWYGRLVRGWQPRAETFDFIFYDGADLLRNESALPEFLADGPPPVLFTFGTAISAAGTWFQAAALACERLGVRGILLGGDAADLPGDLSKNVIHARYLAFSTQLTRMAAIVHPGGIGTCSQALRAAVPQLVVPLVHDQFDNAVRVERLGAGATLARTDFSADSLTRRLGDLLDNGFVRARCGSVAALMKSADGRYDIATAIEEVGRARPRGAPLGETRFDSRGA